MNEAIIRQQGFNDNASGHKFYDNPFEKDSLNYDLWDEGWGIREAQMDMFKELGPAVKTEDESCRCASKTVCPHCGEEIKVTLE